MASTKNVWRDRFMALAVSGVALVAAGCSLSVSSDQNGQPGGLAGGNGRPGAYDINRVAQGSDLVSAGDEQTCAIRDGKVHCFGRWVGSNSTPTGLPKALQVAVGGGSRVCALTVGGVYCWTLNGSSSASAPLMQAVTLSSPSRIAISAYMGCALVPEGVRCWDISYVTAYDKAPATTRLIKDLGKPALIQVKGAMVCGATDGVLKCFEYKNGGLKQVLAPTRWMNFMASGGNPCAVDGSKVACWNLNYYGQSELSLADLGVTMPTQVSAGMDIACALEVGQVKCAALVREGSTYAPSPASVASVVNVPADLGFVSAIAMGSRHVCAETDRGLRCWGDDDERLDVPDVLAQANGIKQRFNIFELGDLDSGSNYVPDFRLSYKTGVVKMTGSLQMRDGGLIPSEIYKYRLVDTKSGKSLTEWAAFKTSTSSRLSFEFAPSYSYEAQPVIDAIETLQLQVSPTSNRDNAQFINLGKSQMECLTDYGSEYPYSKICHLN